MSINKNRTPIKEISCRALIATLIVSFSLASWQVLASLQEVDQYQKLSALESWDHLRAYAKSEMLLVVMLIEQRHCGFCRRAKSERLGPASLSKDYTSKVVFVSVATDLDEPPIERDGALVSTFEFAEAFDAQITPTVMFLNHLGEEVQPRMIGYKANAAESYIFETRLSEAIRLASQTK